MSEIGLVELTVLDSMLDGELKCESTHSDPHNLVCTEMVTYRANGCINHGINICQANADYIIDNFINGPVVCIHCHQMCIELWPI